MTDSPVRLRRRPWALLWRHNAGKSSLPLHRIKAGCFWHPHTNGCRLAWGETTTKADYPVSRLRRDGFTTASNGDISFVSFKVVNPMWNHLAFAEMFIVVVSPQARQLSYNSTSHPGTDYLNALFSCSLYLQQDFEGSLARLKNRWCGIVHPALHSFR